MRQVSRKCSMVDNRANLISFKLQLYLVDMKMFMGYRRKDHTCISSSRAHNLHTGFPNGCAWCSCLELGWLHMEHNHSTCAHNLVGLTLFCSLLHHMLPSLSLMYLLYPLNPLTQIQNRHSATVYQSLVHRLNPPSSKLRER